MVEVQVKHRKCAEATHFTAAYRLLHASRLNSYHADIIRLEYSIPWLRRCGDYGG